MGVGIKGISIAVPENKVGIDELILRYGKTRTENTVKLTGVHNRHIAVDSVKTLELAQYAAKDVLSNSCVVEDTIGAIILITQTPEYRLPATACILQKKLGLPQSCMAFDINLGCSGYPYGLMVASSLIESNLLDTVLLIVGDITNSTASPEDISTYSLFSDAYSATILQRTEGKGDFIACDFGTDGEGWKNLINPVGAFRYPNINIFHETKHEAGLGDLKYPEYTNMNGDEVFVFCLKRLPQTINAVLDKAKMKKDDIDYFIFHQANKFILDHIGKKMAISEKMPISLSDYGNTSSASIPLTICDMVAKQKLQTEHKYMLVGFGVGFSWSSIILTIDSKSVFGIKEY